MPIRPITLYPRPVLRARAAEVAPPDAETERLVADMLDTMRAAQGVGLAAPQVGVSSRVFVYDYAGQAGHVVNPVLETFGEPDVQDEGCLSIPGVYGAVTRPLGAVLRGQDITGAAVRMEASGYLARIWQHETDHLDGVLFLDRLGLRERRRALKEVRAAAWFGDELRRDHLSGDPAYADR